MHKMYIQCAYRVCTWAHSHATGRYKDSYRYYFFTRWNAKINGRQGKIYTQNIEWSCLLVINNRNDCVVHATACPCVLREIFIREHEQVSGTKTTEKQATERKKLHEHSFAHPPLHPHLSLKNALYSTWGAIYIRDFNSLSFSHSFIRLCNIRLIIVLTLWRRQIIYGFGWI